jgi:hypothetical protein
MKHRPLLLVVPLIAVFLFVTAGAASALGVVKVSNAAPTPGTAITVTSTGWSAGQAVTVAIGGSQDTLARVTADAAGAVHARVTIPVDVTLDVNALWVIGRSATGISQMIVTPLSVHRLGPAPAPTRPWGLIIALGGIAGALLIVSVLTVKPVARLTSSGSVVPS